MNLQKLAQYSLPVVPLLVSWEIAGSVSSRVAFIFGRPSEILREFIQGVLSGRLVIDGAVTGIETVSGFLLGTVLGTTIGFLLWLFPPVARLSRPYVIALGAVPVFAVAPMVIVWFGIGLRMKIAMATFSTILVALSQAYEGALQVDPQLLKTLEARRFARSLLLQKVIFPASISWVFASLKLNVGFALLGAFIGEFIAAERGIGYFMLRAGGLYQISKVLAGGLMLIILSLLLNAGVYYLVTVRTRIIEWISVPSLVHRTVLH